MPEDDGYQSFDADRARIADELANLVDRSTKGSIDEPMEDFLNLFNAHPDWITTSTCSGRLVTYLSGSNAVVSSDKPSAVNGKGGGDWLFVSHSTLSPSQLANPVSTLFGGRDVDTTRCVRASTSKDHRIVQLIYQPPVLHIMARSLTIAATVLRGAIAAGFRNSGLTLSQTGRVILAIRSSAGGLDVPIGQLAAQTSDQSFDLLVGEDYLSDLLMMGNELMEKNEARLNRLLVACKSCLNQPDQGSEWESPSDRRSRMRAEGLAMQSEKTSSNVRTSTSEDGDEDTILDAVNMFVQ